MKKGGAHTSGFTIVETLIVLAISALLAVSALALVNGRQNKTEFQTAINGLSQQLQQIINETSSGYYPNNNNFSCQVSPSGTTPQFGAAGPAQGTNTDCMFVGKTIRFGSAGGGSLKADAYTVYPLVANRLTNSGVDASCYLVSLPTCTAVDAHIIAIAPSTVHAGYADDTTTTLLGGGLTFKWAKYTNSAGLTTSSNPTYPIALVSFLSNLATFSSGQLNSGSQQMALYSFSSVPVALGVGTQNSQQVADAIYQNALQSYQSVALCFQSGTTQQSGLITIGSGTSGGLGVNLAIKGTTNC